MEQAGAVSDARARARREEIGRAGQVSKEGHAHTCVCSVRYIGQEGSKP